MYSVNIHAKVKSNHDENKCIDVVIVVGFNDLINFKIDTAAEVSILSKAIYDGMHEKPEFTAYSSPLYLSIDFRHTAPGAGLKCARSSPSLFKHILSLHPYVFSILSYLLHHLHPFPWVVVERR